MPAQRDLTDRAANLLGKSRSDLILEAAGGCFEAVMLSQTFFNLDIEKFRQFTSHAGCSVRGYRALATGAVAHLEATCFGTDRRL
ncbi:type II toxin-antitoxin system TacA family antitoxin [Paraburkholderia fungorum]|uniref:type II toxin-antitoxin system TacA family antitoxin n=1 Tax=Paraburkholderia fungorum TaxID=134537 RepID=UPI0038B7BBB1